MGNPFKSSKPSAPAPTAEPVKKVETPAKTEVQTARIQAKETMAGPTRRRRGTLGRISSLLSGGYRGFGQEDKLG